MAQVFMYFEWIAWKNGKVVGKAIFPIVCLWHQHEDSEGMPTTFCVYRFALWNAVCYTGQLYNMRKLKEGEWPECRTKSHY